MEIGNIWKIGVSENLDLEDRMRTMFSNGVYIILGSVILLQEIITGGIVEIFSNASVTSLIPFGLIGLAGSCLILNYFRLYLVSRISFTLAWIFFVSIFRVIYLGPSPTMYFTHPFYIVLFSPVIQLLFSQKKEKFTLLLFLSITFLLVLFSTDFLLAFESSPDPKVPLVNSVNVMKITFCVLWLSNNTLMAYVLKTNRDFYNALEEQKELVGQHRQLLQLRNEELSNANNELINLNKQVYLLNEILEKRVTERTHELTERNKTLSDYAFMNAHLLRSPVSRIKGLINLFQITTDPEEKLKVQEILLQSAEDLDQVVHSISEKLNENRVK